MNSEGYRAYWFARGGLKTWSRNLRSEISPEAEMALFTLGFPVVELFGFTMKDPIQLVGDGIRCFVLFNEFGKIATLDGDAVICTDETMTGVYVNRSVPDFLFSLTIIHRNMDEAGNKEHDQAVIRTRQDLMNLDDTAFDRDGNFWPLFFASHGFT